MLPDLKTLQRFILITLATAVLLPPVARSDTVLFEDGFEQVATLMELFKSDGSRWTNLTRTSKTNQLEIKRDSVPSGKQALCFQADPHTGEVSKASIHHEGFDLREGQRIRVGASVYIPSGKSLNEVFLVDLECVKCWPADSSYPNKSPGVRLALKKDEGFVTIDRGKIGYRKDHLQPVKNMPVPRDRWFRLEWLMTLSTSADGRTEVYIDGDKVLESAGVNLPNPDYVEQKFGISLKRPMRYDRLEVGITANSSIVPQTVCMDDISLTQL